MAAKKPRTINPPKTSTTTPPATTQAEPAKPALALAPPGMMKLVCMFQHAWGTKVHVGEEIVEISATDGTLVVSGEAAKALLQNVEKYAVYTGAPVRFAGKRQTFAEANPGVPNAVLVDPRTRRVLDDDEALRILKPANEKSGEIGMTGKLGAEPTDPLTAHAAQISSAPSNVTTVKASSVAIVDGKVAPVDAIEQTRDEQIAAETLRIHAEKQMAAQAALPVAIEGSAPQSQVAEASWPAVSDRMNKAELMLVLGRLKASGIAVDDSAAATKTKDGILDQIQKGYAKL